MTEFTRTSPTSGGILPEGFTEIGGIVLDLVGLSGTRVVSQLAASDLFVGYFDNGDPASFRGNPGTIGIQTGFTQSTVDALGGGLAEVAIRLTVDDGDTAPGNFDDDLNTLLLNGVEFGNFSDVMTQETSPDGTGLLRASQGFPNNDLATGWFYSSDATTLANFFSTLPSLEVSFQLDDVDPYDNFFDFTQGVDGSLIDVGSGPNAAPTAEADTFSITPDQPLSGSLFEDNGAGPDRDADGDAITITEVNGTAADVGQAVVLTSGAVVTVSSDGTFDYEPSGAFGGLAPGATASDEFEYTISDGRGGTDTTSVTIEVSRPPVMIELPNSLAPGQTGAARISEASDGTVPVIVALSGERSLLADPFAGGFSESVFVLDRAQSAGIEVSIKGTAGPRSTASATARIADTDAVTDIAARTIAFQPEFLPQATLDRIAANLEAQFGETIGSLAGSLAQHAALFEGFGLNANSATAALAAGIEAAGDYGSILERGQVGSLGQGWATVADLGLAIDGTSVQMQGLTGLSALRALSIEGSALYTVSKSADRAVALSGDALSLSSQSRPTFEQGRDGKFQTTSAFNGNLEQTDSGYAVSLDDGTTLQFAGDGTFRRMVAADGRTTEATLDGEGRIVSLTGPNNRNLTFTRSADGQIEKVKDADGREATFEYNADGQLSGVTRPDGTSSFGYAENGDLISATAPGNITGTFTYDERGRLEGASYGGGLQTESFDYDDAGGLTITDGAGRTTEIDLLPGSVVGRVTDGAGEASEIIYDDNGAIAGIRAADGTETRFTFDDQNRLTQITDANGAVLGFSYGEDGEQPASFTDAGGNTRSFDYDAGGRITEASWPDGTQLEFDYDDKGNLTGYSNRRGDDVTYTYDERGRLLSESDSSAGPTTYIYDASGRLTSATNDQGTTSLAYDSADRVTQIDYPTGKSLSFTYNEAGLRASMSDGDDYNVFYDYDALGRLTGLRDEDSSFVAYQYDAAGNLVREENGNGTITTYDYDAAGRLTVIENLAPDSSVNSRTAYTYDAAGQRVAMETLDGTWDYGYDAIGQLTSAEFTSTNAEIADKSITYEYDAAGNRTRVVEDGVETLYTANALNQYTQVADATFTYDDDGNMTSRTDGSGTTSYTYDLDNRLVSVTEADGTVLQFGYDVFGNRVSKTVDGAETEYLVDPFGLGDVVSEFSGSARTASFVHGLGLAAGEIGGTDAWYDADGVGSVTALTGVDGSVVNAYAYTPFGTEMREVEGVANSFEFNGVLGVAEDSDDLTFMRARSYSDELGRFLAEDPLWFKGDIENLYRFAGNSPSNFSDPTGLYLSYEQRNQEPDPGISYSEDQKRDTAARYRAPVYDEEQTKILAGIIAREAGEVAVSVAVGSKVKAGKGLLEGIKEGLETYVSLNDWQDKIEEVRKILEDMNKDEDGGGPTDPPPPGDDSPVDPPIPPRKPDPDIPIPPEKPPFGDVPIPARKPTDIDPATGDGRNDGDPHLSTFDGTGYSFQAVGEFTMVLGDDFEIQTRTEAINSSVSVNTATAMSIGDDVVGIYAREAIPLVVNGTAVALEQGESIAVGDGSVYRGNFGRGDEFGNFDVYVVMDGAGNGFWVNVYSGSNHLRPFVSGEGDLSGLLGNLNDDRMDDFQLRDGTVLSQPLPQTVLYGAFADSWRITQEDSLFLYRDGESTETFTDRSFPTNIVRLSDLDPAVRAAAEAVALSNGLTPGTFEFETTVLDVALTGNEDFAVGVGGAPEFEAEGEETETIEVEINEAPTAGADEAFVDEDGSVDISVLGNDTDPEDDDLFLIGASDANGGTTEIVGGLVRFAPAADFEGQTTVTYQLGDSAGNVVAGTITVDVTGVNDDPDAVDDDGFTTGRNTPIVITLADLLANDSDPDSAGITVLEVFDAEVGNGTVVDNGDGTVTFTPDAGFTGTALFGYSIEDGDGGEDSALVEIAVTAPDNTAPVAGVVAPVFSEEDGPANVDLLAGASDPDGDSLSVVGATVTSGDGAGVTINADGTLTVDPDAYNALGTGESEVITVSYDISDGALSTATSATITVNGVNDAPFVTDAATSTPEDTPIVDLALAINASDPEGDDLTFTLQDASQANGQVTIQPDGTLTYTPDEDFFGDAFFTYSVSDGQGGIVEGVRFDITVTPVNDAPDLVTADLGTVSEDGAPVTFDALGAVTDVDSDLGDLSVSNVTASWSGGALTATLAGGVITFDPDQLGAALDAGETAAVTIGFDSSDGIDTTAGNTLTLTVTGADDGPTGPLLVEGTDGIDRLTGTAADERLVSKGGRIDYQTGGGGADEFVFGDETSNGVIETDYITDFGADDSLDLGGVGIAREINSRGNTYLVLEGDGDIVALLGVADYDDGLLTT